MHMHIIFALRIYYCEIFFLHLGHIRKGWIKAYDANSKTSYSHFTKAEKMKAWKLDCSNTCRYLNEDQIGNFIFRHMVIYILMEDLVSLSDYLLPIVVIQRFIANIVKWHVSRFVISYTVSDVRKPPFIYLLSSLFCENGAHFASRKNANDFIHVFNIINDITHHHFLF